MAAAQSFDRLMQESEQLEREIAQSQADAAAMRESLEFAKKHAVFPLGMVFDKPWDKVNAALSTTAGADLLERLRKAEEENTNDSYRINDLKIEIAGLKVDVLKLEIERDSLRAELEVYKDSAGFCEKHKPTGGVRNCLVYGCINLSHAIDQICYTCEEPNEMEVSSYTVNQNADAVVEQVKKLRAEVEDLRAFKKEVDSEGVVPASRVQLLEDLSTEVERLREDKAQVLSRYTTAWHALNAIAADGSPYAKRMVEELPRPAIDAARKEQL